MRLISISEIAQMDDKEIIRAVQGTITKIYKHKACGEGTIQLLHLKQGRDEISVKAFDHEPIPMNWRGKEVIFEAFQSNKGYTGVYASDDEYNKAQKVERIIKLTTTAQVYLADEDESREPAGAPRSERPQDNPPPRQQQDEGRHSPRHPSAPPQNGNGNLTKEEREYRAVLNAKKFMARNANLYNLALDVVAHVIEPHFCTLYAVETMPEAIKQQAIASMVIPAREAALDGGLPLKPIKTEPIKPAPPAQATVPAEPQRVEPPAPLAPLPGQRPPEDPADDDEIPF